MVLLSGLKRRASAFLAAFALLVVLVPAVSAMRVSPMILEMETRGSNASARIEVQNLNQDKLAFQTRVFRIEYDKDGKITESPADDQFLVFPPQGLLPPSARQVIRLQWVGDPDLAVSQAFYVSVEQLPVALEPGSQDAASAQVQILYNMRALVVVAPPGAKPDVGAVSATQIKYQPPTPPGMTEEAPLQDGVAVTLRNDGKRHAMMANFGWRLEGVDRDDKPKRVDVSPTDLSRLVGSGYVPAEGERTFKLPIPGFGPGPIKVSFVK